MDKSATQATQNQALQTLFYVFHESEQQGPFSLAEIALKVRTHQLEMSDYLYVEALSDWTVLVAFAPLSELVKDVIAHKQVSKNSNDTPSPDEWFALKGNLRFGPFTYNELVRLLQEKSMYDSDFVWHAGIMDWQKVCEMKEFSPDAIRKLREAGHAQLDEVFFRRRHARVQHNASIIMHNNQKVFRGKSIEISAGGAGIVLENSNLDVGTQVFLHFKPATDLPPFNAVCEVVSRRPVNSADQLAPYHYGVKFLKIETKLTHAIEEFALRVKKAA